MEIGIVGLPGSGKSTLFEVMTGVRSLDLHGEGCVRGQATVPDGRFDRLVTIFDPRKATPAPVPFVDVHVPGERAWESMRRHLSSVDALLHVVDGFTDPDPAGIRRRYRELAEEFLFSDLLIVEKRLERLVRLSAKALQPADAVQLQILPRLKARLEENQPLRTCALTPEEQVAIRHFAFWTLRPELVVVNTAEGDGGRPPVAALADLPSPVLSVCGKIEAEISALDPAEQGGYLEALGIAEPAVHRVIRAAFSLLGRITYFTVGQDEVKAWVIPEGCRAPRAAAAIHEDLARGFIRAEVAAYEDFLAAGETLAAAKAAGKLRLEGKDYVVRDGDIISFRFHV